MKIKNTSGYPVHLLRRMISWICRQYKMPVRSINGIEFSKSGYGNLGIARCDRSVLVKTGFAPRKSKTYSGRSPDNGWPVTVINDHIDGLVNTTAHELYHVDEMRQGILKPSTYRRSLRTACEKRTERMAKWITELFQSQREKLLAEWNYVKPSVEPVAVIAEPVAELPVIPVIADRPATSGMIAKRAAKALCDLARWERKLKLAKGKVAKYRKRVRYYEKSLSKGG